MEEAAVAQDVVEVLDRWAADRVVLVVGPGATDPAEAEAPMHREGVVDCVVIKDHNLEFSDARVMAQHTVSPVDKRAVPDDHGIYRDVSEVDWPAIANVCVVQAAGLCEDRIRDLALVCRDGRLNRGSSGAAQDATVNSATQ